MIFGQINRDHEKGSTRIDVSFINRNPQIFAKYEVVANKQCMEEIEVPIFRSAFDRMFNRNVKMRKVMQPSPLVYLRDHQLICHPSLATNLEKVLREYTAKVLSTVE